MDPLVVSCVLVVLFFSMTVTDDALGKVGSCDERERGGDHAAGVQKVCRIGDAEFNFLSMRTSYPVKDFAGCFGVDLSEDVDGIYPPSICQLCCLVLARYTRLFEIKQVSKPPEKL